jgi:hypothetical protein
VSIKKSVALGIILPVAIILSHPSFPIAKKAGAAVLILALGATILAASILPLVVVMMKYGLIP